MDREKTQKWLSQVAGEMFSKHKDARDQGAHCDVYDDGYAFAGRVCSFELDRDGVVTWFSYRENAVERCEWPLKLVMEITSGKEQEVRRLTAWVRPTYWEDAERSAVAS